VIDLLPFQAEDVLKLKVQRARLIGNDPGTGKTYEGIALDQLNRKGDGNAKVDVASLFTDRGLALKTLVVAPKSVLNVWDMHLMELTEDDVYIYDYHSRHKFMKAAANPKVPGYFVMNYESVRIKDAEVLRNVAWFHIIGDEIHRAKNKKSQHTQALWKLKALYKTGMSGTPANNRPQDLWGILHWLWPNFYTSYWAFVNTYIKVTKEETPDGTGYRKLNEPNEETLPYLHKQMAPWYVRRRKEDVLKDLPPKYYSPVWVDLSPKQRVAYDQMKKTMVAWVEDHATEIQNPIIANAAISQLVRLQQYASGFMVPELDKEGNQKYKLVWKKLKDGWREQVEVPIYTMTEPSSKIDTLMDILEDRGDEQIIIFTRFKQVANLVVDRLEKSGKTYGLLTGDVPQKVRDRYVDDFQAGRLQYFVGTIQAGGEGITLTAASTVIFLDRWWNPGVNGQAEDRAHRIGQENAVEIIDIMARNTVDLGQHQQLQRKASWLAMLLGDTIDVNQVLEDIDFDLMYEEEESTTDAA
jgi:SNF2 family DNA or RNA helicase